MQQIKCTRTWFKKNDKFLFPGGETTTRDPNNEKM